MATLSEEPARELENEIDDILRRFGNLPGNLQDSLLVKLVNSSNCAQRSVLKSSLARTENVDIVSKVPIELSTHIFSFCDWKDLSAASCVNWNWYHRVNEPALYRDLCKTSMSPKQYRTCFNFCTDQPAFWKAAFRERARIVSNFENGNVSEILTWKDTNIPFTALLLMGMRLCLPQKMVLFEFGKCLLGSVFVF